MSIHASSTSGPDDRQARRWSDQSSVCKQDNHLTGPKPQVAGLNWSREDEGYLVDQEGEREIWEAGCRRGSGRALDVNKQDDWRQRCKEQVQLCLTSFNQVFEREKWINHAAGIMAVC